MRASFAVVLTALLVFVVAGCGGQDDSTPVACLQGQDLYLAALEGAPGDVRLAGDTPISECLAENQQAGDLARVGEAMVETATLLNVEARANPEGPASLRLGYLIGAAERGADRTEGIHANLVRRLTVAARFSPEGPPPPSSLTGYREGFDAGRAGG